ncbi:SAM-dependent methyltransferase [Caulobacter sp. CCUG 60055]|nr:SAM-dependent methyltransferase [Caulobacter sp. CCUG 60055]MCI3180657.1 SAM-dependent methyltransferase [Caulobacter sp. CCUG 60055]
MSLKDRLKAQIAAEGPLTVAQYMTACLHDPQDGYYAARPARRPVLGEDGDFITAPLVSQMFGELIGLWAVEAWSRLGRPARFRLVEAGPGDGTLMSDLLRAARLAPDFLAAADLWLIETSAPLRARQAQALAGLAPSPRWADGLGEVPGGAPLILVANELLDCLPVRQFVRDAGGWAERMVGLGPDGELAFGLRKVPAPRIGAAPPVGAVLEISAAQAAFGAELGARLAADGGAALLIDYGRDQPDVGDTLQALRRHRKESPLASPGEADLTVHADFPAVRAAAEAAGAASAILAQAGFLERLGVRQRAEALARARPDRAATVARQLARLTEADQMGVLFKVAAFWSPPAAVPPAFEDV